MSKGSNSRTFSKDGAKSISENKFWQTTEYAKNKDKKLTSK